ncbi:MAG: metallo-mystery pair system four-Cys motif protein [Oleiphilaceae bacterium]|nr:metallo-mystery pair system four-Cys motif protein [Oleiphilaceae bacterium]
MRHIFKGLLALSLTAMLNACTSGGDPSPQTLRLIFFAETDTQRVACSDLSNLGSENVNASVRDLRFYIHDIVLRNVAGERFSFTPFTNDYQSSRVAMVDFTNLDAECQGVAKEDHNEILGSVLSHEGVVYTSIEFRIGVPSSLNHNDPASAAAPLDDTSMHIDRTQGYKFLRLKLDPENSSEWLFELSSTGCTGDPSIGESVSCERSNRPRIRLSDLDIERDNIVLNIQDLLAQIDIDNDANRGCDSSEDDPECVNLLRNLGLNETTGNPFNDNTQTVFSAD